ncbi:MAG: hypothetical protein U5K75_05660 [Ahrensia sp.]|nr:hypothetical protein [Ahrensia sp.]
MNVEPKIGPDASNARGQIVFVETPRGRMTQVCITNAASFGSAVSKFSALTNAIRLPE